MPFRDNDDTVLTTAYPSMAGINTNVLVVVANYDFSRNADRMRRRFSSRFPTLLVDASSPSPPKSPSITIPNTYYTGLWNEAVRLALERETEWLLFVASDVLIREWKRVSDLVTDVIRDSAIGVYTSSLSGNSRVAFKSTLCHKTNRLRRCGLVEGFAFLARTKILKELYPVPASNKYGWGIDIVTCEKAKQLGYQVVTDDRAVMMHPKSKAQHQIDEVVAREMSYAYAESMGFSREVIDHTYEMTQRPSYRFHHRNLSMQRSLDLGCGVRPKNIYSADELYGIDLSPQLSDEQVHIRVADLAIEPIPWPDEYFDVITAFDFIEHIPRLAFVPERRHPFISLMNEIWRCLKPDGIFHSLTPAYPAKEAFQDPTHVNIITEDTFSFYFCGPRWAEMYGFNGSFLLESQEWEDECKLKTVIRKVTAFNS
ncbi:class I SAM-dependent methyltransferase [Cyanobium gracile]|nr:class I SAM-dependent methyltransferase [Cyanobium gracile]